MSPDSHSKFALNMTYNLIHFDTGLSLLELSEQSTFVGANHIIWVNKVPTENDILYGIFNPYIGIDDHSYDGNHINGIKDLTDKWIGVSSHS